jgi:hypothetical protein
MVMFLCLVDLDKIAKFATLSNHELLQPLFSRLGLEILALCAMFGAQRRSVLQVITGYGFDSFTAIFCYDAKL